MEASWWIFNSIFKSFDSPLYVLTCDNVTNIDFKKIEKDYYKKGQPICMIIPTKPIKGLAGDYIFRKKNIIQGLSRKVKSDIYCTKDGDMKTEKRVDYMLPIIADGEAGFGGPLNVFELAKKFIKAGAAGVHFEDQLASEKKCGHMGGKVLVPTGT